MRKSAIGIGIGLFVIMVVGMGLSVRWVAAEGGGLTAPFGGVEAYGSQLFFEGAGFVRFDITNPEDGTLITETGSLYTGIDFANDIFGTAYALTGTTLLAVDTTTGAETIIGAAVPMTEEVWSGMTWDRTTSTMYAVAHTACDGSATAGLYTVDLATGAATRVGAVSNGGCLGDVAAHPLTGGLYGVNSETDQTLTINTETGAGTVLGALGFNARDSEHGMDFDDSTGVLYYAHTVGPGCCSGLEVYTVSLSTGALNRIYQGMSELGMDDFAIAVSGSGLPQVVVEPDEYFAVHDMPPQVTTAIMVISNTGEGPLTWSLFEDEGSVPPGLPGTPAPIYPEWVEMITTSAENDDATPVLVHTEQPASPSGLIHLLLDDGTFEYRVGREGGGQFIWLNRFTPNPADYPFTLTDLQVMAGENSGCPPGQKIDLHVYTDVDGDPTTGATHVGSVLNQPIGNANVFHHYQVNIPLEEPGDILIAVVNRECTGAGTQPAAIDKSNSQQRSWFGYYTDTQNIPPVLPPPVFGLIDNFGVEGNWLIRAEGRTYGEVCDAPADIGWLSVEPLTGTKAAGDGDEVELTFDSHGYIQIGTTYTGTLCLESNDPATPLLRIPVYLALPWVDAVTLADLSVTSNPHWLAPVFFGLLVLAALVAQRKTAVNS